MFPKEKAFLIGVNVNRNHHFDESMNELKNLALACNYEVVGQAEQNLKEIHHTFYIGSGKLEEMKCLARDLEADLMIVNNELSPSQLRNLAKKLEIRIIDRTSLILDIFASRAKTREAKLQVEVARIQYMLPRLIGLNESLAQQTGGVGAITRGTGEKALELDRRRLERKIYELNKELELISSERQIQRKKRSKSNLPTVALVGYTNSGKSTLMNALLEFSRKPKSKKVLEKDMFFATLDTSVRKIALPGNQNFLLSDTVGFVSDLPHDLVKAFRSTLEEVKTADLLLHIVDVSDPDYEQQIRVTENTLKEIGADHIPILHLFNKIDLTSESELQTNADDEVFISARKKIGLEELLKKISREIFKEYIECRMFIPYEQGQVLSYLNENTFIVTTRHEEKGTLLTLKCRQSDYERFKQFID